MATEDYPPCEVCGKSGLVTVYHKFYEGSQAVIWEHTDRFGEVKTIRSAGTVSAHCSCGLGRWMRGQTADELRSRIPDLVDVLAGRTNYRATDPTTEMDMPLPTHEAERFLRRWRNGMPRYFQPVPLAPRKAEPEDVGAALHRRNEALRETPDPLEVP